MKWRPDPRAEFVCWGLAGLTAFIVTGLLGWDSFLQGPDSNLQPVVDRVLLMILGGVVWFGLGVLLTMAMTWFRSVRERSRAGKLAAVASALGLKHSLEPLPYFRRYRSFDILLTHTDRDSHLQNHLYGMFKSQPVDVVDLEYYIQRGNATGTYRQTIFIFPAGDQKLPVFRIQPQTSTRLERTLLGEPGTVFWEQGPQGKAKQDDAAKRSRHKFHDNYEITCGYSPTQRRLVDNSPNVPNPETEDCNQLEVQLRRLFDESLLQFFAHVPGWHVESVGEYLAVWETGRFVRPNQLENHLVSALEVVDQVCGALPRAKSAADATRRVEAVTGVQQKRQRKFTAISALLGALFGAISSGLTVAGALTLIQRWYPRHVMTIEAIPFVPLAVVFGLMVGIVGGLVIGARVVGPAVRSFRPSAGQKSKGCQVQRSLR